MESDSVSGERHEEESRESCSFYVAGVPAIVFNKDPETSIRVSRYWYSAS